jgi:hypothetical protein
MELCGNALWTEENSFTQLQIMLGLISLYINGKKKKENKCVLKYMLLVWGSRKHKTLFYMETSLNMKRLIKVLRHLVQQNNFAGICANA